MADLNSMNELLLTDYRKLTRDQQIELYKWLTMNAHMLKELRDKKRAHCDEHWNIVKSRRKKIEEHFEYMDTLDKRVKEKRAERHVLSEIIGGMKDVSQELESNLKELDPEVDFIHKYCQNVEERNENMNNKVAKCFEQVDELKLELMIEDDMKKADVDVAKTEYEQRTQSYETTKVMYTDKCRKMEDLLSQQIECNDELRELKLDDIKAKKEDKVADKERLQKILEDKKSDLFDRRIEVEELREKNLQMTKLVEEVKIVMEQKTDRNKVKRKELENYELLFSKSVATKFKDEMNKLDIINKTGCNTLRDMMKQIEILTEKKIRMQDSINAYQHQFKLMNLEKDDILKRIKKAENCYETYKDELDELPNYEKDKIEAEQEKIEKLLKDIEEMKVKCVEKIGEVDNDENIVKRFKDYYDDDLSVWSESGTNGNQAEMESANSSSCCSSDKLSNTASLFKVTNAKEIIMLDPVQSSESIQNKSNN